VKLGTFGPPYQSQRSQSQTSEKRPTFWRSDEQNIHRIKIRWPQNNISDKHNESIKVWFVCEI